MKRDLCLMAALCLLVSFLAVAMATEGKTGPGPLVVAMATEEKTGQGPLSPLENVHRQSSTKLGPEYEQRTTGSNSSVTAAGKGHIHVFSSNDQDKSVLEPSVSVSQDGKAQMPPDTSNEKNPSSITVSPYDPAEDHGTGRLLVAVARTLVTTTASTTTVTALYTCHNPAPLPATACSGRRKRKQGTSSIITVNSEAGLDSSIARELVLFDKPVERTGRLILWSSSITTVIITTTSTNTAITVTASYTCLATGLVLCG